VVSWSKPKAKLDPVLLSKLASKYATRHWFEVWATLSKMNFPVDYLILCKTEFKFDPQVKVRNLFSIQRKTTKAPFLLSIQATT